MEINEVTQERLADKFKSAMKREGLLYKDVASNFDTSATMLREMMSGRAPNEQEEWTKVRTWHISDKPLRDFIIESTPKPEFDPQSAEAIVRKAVMKMKAKRHRKELAEAVADSITTEDGTTTIDVSELNKRTGTRVTVDILEGGYIITVTNLPK